MSPAAAERMSQPRHEVPILMYHSVADGCDPRFRRFVVPPAEFAAQMEYLASAGYRPITAAELAARRAAGQQHPPGAVVLTFDDGFTDFYSTVLPVLRRHLFSATLYVPTRYVGASARWLAVCGEADRAVMSWSALADVAAEGVEVAAHSHSHPQLDRVDRGVALDEAKRSRGLLEDHLGQTVRGFAYPFGYWNRAARDAVAVAGFSYACAVDELASAPGDDLLAVPRLSVNAGLGVPGLARLMAARSGRASRWVAGGKRYTWRVLRERVNALGGDPLGGSAE